jgi:hypothetical protein
MKTAPYLADLTEAQGALLTHSFLSNDATTAAPSRTKYSTASASQPFSCTGERSLHVSLTC